jgi:hypothetical protein
MLHPHFATGQRGRETLSCAPFADRPDQVEPVWRFLAGRSGGVGWRLPEAPDLDDEPDLHIVVGAHRMRPVTVNDGQYWFVLPRGDAPVRLVSRTARPDEARPWINDIRRLGVRVGALAYRNDDAGRVIAMDSPVLDQGWWDVETDDGVPSRWTDGDAVLPQLGQGVLSVKLAGSMRYPKESVSAGGGMREPGQSVRRVALRR